MNTRSTAGIALAIAAATFPSPARAQTYHFYDPGGGQVIPAAACVGDDEFNNRFTRQNGKLRNSSGTNDLPVVCPLQEERDGLPQFAAAAIVVSETIAPGDCLVVDRPFDGSSGESYSYDYSTDLGTTTQIVWVSNGGTGQMPVTLVANHTVTIVCEVDNGETLYNYHADSDPS
jgi:hypothetical protein